VEVGIYMKNVLEMLENTGVRYPDKIAIYDEDSSLSYKDYLEKSKTIGSYLINYLDKQINKPIVVFIDRNIESILTFMGIVYSGNTYVPIDCSQPVERIRSMLNAINPVLLINANTTVNPADFSKFEYMDFSNLFDSSINQEDLNLIRNKTIDYDPVYIMFTSGSTGIPKGIAISHRSIIDLIIQFHKTFEIDETSTYANQAPFDFDVSVKDIYNAMYSGGTIYIVPKKLFSSPPLLLNFLIDKEINTLVWATSALRIIENFDAFTVAIPSNLKLVMFSGEIMPNRILNYWRRYLPDTDFVNLYGPTEITCNCTYFKVNRKFDNEDSLPIGLPFQNSRVFLLDLENSSLITESNKKGEICVSGTSLALGYYNNEEQTNVSFVKNPIHNHFNETIYKTGDIGYWNDNEELMFVSRKDSQIKHMGHRIELSEIEIKVYSFDEISAAFCHHENEKIYLFYSSDQEMNRELKRKLLKLLPKYMVPNQFVYVNEMPLNKNNKIDRKRIINEYFKSK